MYSSSTSNSSIRYRSGSVERRNGSIAKDPAPYRTSYGVDRGRSRDLPSSTASASTRMSRATSYDPFPSTARSNSVMRSSLTNSDYSSSYTPRNSISNRYGSTEQLNSYKPTSSTFSSSYRPSTSSSSSYTPRNIRAGSVSIGAYDSHSGGRNQPSDSVSNTYSRYRPTETSAFSSSLSKYRSADISTTSDYSSLKYRSPNNSYNSRCSSTSSQSSQSPKDFSSSRFDFRSKPPNSYSSRNTSSSSYKSDRDYRSMSRSSEAEKEEEEKDNDTTFKDLYRKYVTNSSRKTKIEDEEEGSLAEKVTRRFESKSEAEESDTSLCEDVLSKYQNKGLRRASSASSITPKASVCNTPSIDMTPKCSPLPHRKVYVNKTPDSSEDEEEKPKPKCEIENKSISQIKTDDPIFDDVPPLQPDSEEEESEDDDEISKKIQETISARQQFIDKFKDVEMTPAIIKMREIDTGSTTIEKVIQNEKIEEVIEKRTEMKPLSRNIQMEASFGAIQHPPPTPISSKSVQPDGSKKNATTIKINGRMIKNKDELIEKEKEIDIPEKKAKEGPIRITIRADRSKSPIRSSIVDQQSERKDDKEKEKNMSPISIISTPTTTATELPSDRRSEEPLRVQNHPTIIVDDESQKRAKSVENETKANRRRRDPTRTLEHLKSSLIEEKMKENNEKQVNETNEKSKEDNNTNVEKEIIIENIEEKKTRRIPIPLVLITAPSTPSTPLATTPVTTAASICLWNQKESSPVSATSTSEEEDEDEYEDEEDEYSSGDWTEGEDEEVEGEEEYGSDCEFSVSQTFSLKDHIPLGNLYPLTNSSSATSALVSEFDTSDTFLAKGRKEESRGRVDSLFAKPAPTFTCSVSYNDMSPEDDDEWSDEVHSCDEGDDDDFRVLPIARPGSSSLGAYMSPGSATSDEDYDGTTVGCTLKLVDRAARKDSQESDESEYYDDDEEQEYSGEDEEYTDEEYEYDEEEEEIEDEEYEYEDEEVLEEYIDEEESCDDITMRSVEVEDEDEISEIEESIALDTVMETSKPIKKLPEIALMTVSQIEELIEEGIIDGELPEQQLFALDGVEVEDYTNTNAVNIVPTFVRQMTENVREEMTSRFSDKKPATDFAKKAVIQPTKMEKVNVATIVTKIAEAPKEKKTTTEKETNQQEVTKKGKEELVAVKKPEIEDKSAARKSALNMKDEDAKKKAATDEKVASQKARRLGTVSALTDKFTDSKKEEDKTVLYKKSSRLESKYVEKPKKVYEVIKPVINDDFDKQMEEIRKQMKSGSTDLQTKMKDLSKGILTSAEEAKIKEMEEKRRVTTEKATGAFGKAEEEKARWKASRDAEAEREYARIEAEKHLRKKKILIDKPTAKTLTDQPASEPKRTIRRWKPPPPDPNAVIPSFSSGPKETVKQKAVASQEKVSSKPGTPTSRRKQSQDSVSTTTSSVNGSESKTRSLKQPATENGLSKDLINGASSILEKVPVIKTAPKSEGAAATRIRNNASSPVVANNEKPAAKRYNSRRKTQEIVNESSIQPKTKRRKLNARKKKFIRSDQDVDILFGLEKNLTFEQLEILFEKASRDMIKKEKRDSIRIRRLFPTKIFISDLTDIDKIYKSSEIRDIIASVNMVN